MSDADSKCELMDHLEALLVDPDRDTLTLRADPESGGLRLTWKNVNDFHTMSVDRVEHNPRLMGVNALRLMRKAVGR